MMKQYVILADVACDLSRELCEEFNILPCIEGHVSINATREITAKLDWSEISREEFYKTLSDKKNKVTSAPANVEEYCEIFRQYVRQGYGILSMSLSSKISNTYDFATKAAQRVQGEYPDAQIYCFDSFRMSTAFGLLVLYAHELKSQGKSLEEVAQWLENNKRRVHQMGPIDDLMFIARRGRITMGKAILGSFAGVKPMGDCNANGYVTVIAKAKGIKKALDLTVRYVRQTATKIEDQIVLISHSNREAYALALKELVEKELAPGRVYLSDVFPLCGTNIGPGMVGVYYLGDEVSPELEKEKEIMQALLKS